MFKVKKELIPAQRAVEMKKSALHREAAKGAGLRG
jgi:hypothetical protein